MLEPEFFQVDSEMAAVIKQSGLKYWVTAYSRHNDYTLVQWAYGDDEEYFTGEKLFLGSKIIASSAGALDLENDSSVNLSRAIAQQLRNSFCKP